MIHSSIIPDDKYEPTHGERSMAQSVNFLIGKLLSGDLKGIAVCAINQDDEESAFYLNGGKDDVLRGPMERLKVMYETNRMFGRATTAPLTNRSFRSN